MAQARADDLPDGEGKDLVVRMCSDCHGLIDVVSRRETEKEWLGIIGDMIALGVEGTDEEQKIAAAYLGKYFGREGTPPAAEEPAPARGGSAELRVNSAPMTVTLADEVWQGRLRKLMFHADRNGFFYVFDRTNGEVLMHEPIVGKQNWNLGFTRDGRPIIDPASVSTCDGVAVCPASGGGTN